MPFTTTVANAILDKVLRGVDFTPPTELWISLHTGDPGDTGAAEVEGGSYARQLVTFDVADQKMSLSLDELRWTQMPACTITNLGLWDAETEGVFWWKGNVLETKTVYSGDMFILEVGDLVGEVDKEPEA